MLNIYAIREAIIEANRLSFGESGKRSLKTADWVVDLTENPDFIAVWYRPLYADWLEDIIEGNGYDNKSKYAKVIAVSHKVNKSLTCKRKRIFDLLKGLSGNDDSGNSDMEHTVSVMTDNIRNILVTHCHKTLDSAPSNPFLLSYAGMILDGIIDSKNKESTYTFELSVSYKDRRTELFDIDSFSDYGEEVYRKLALLSMIALIPIDANKEDQKIVEDFSIALNRRYASSERSYCRISKSVVYEAGKRWCEQTGTQGSRFENLDPDITILPLVRGDPESEDVGQPLKDMLSMTSDHLCLIGEGGIGKTTSLFSIMKSAYDDKAASMIAQIPLYIDLSMANSSADISEGHSSFILRSVQRMLPELPGNPSDWEDQLIRLLSDRKGQDPEFALLLDGLNEVSRDGSDEDSTISLLAGEICNIIKYYKNVRIIMTSRSNDVAILGEQAKYTYLSGISSETVEAYLKKKRYSAKRIDRLKANKQLMDLLCIPLFLTMFTQMRGKEDMLTKGEILHAFYANKQTDYSERGRIAKIRSDLRDENSKISGLTPAMISFMLDFILPEISWHMVKRHEFQISLADMVVIAEKVITSQSDVDWCGKPGRICFGEYHNKSDANDNVWKVAQKLRKHLSEGVKDENEWETISLNIFDCLAMQLGILQHAEYGIYKIHQHVRDYFAALYHINRLKLAVFLYNSKKDSGDSSRDCLQEWEDAPLPNQVLCYIGEALGEAHNAPEYDDISEEWKSTVPDLEQTECERNLIQRAFAIYRSRFDIEDGDAVWNLLQILKLVRKDLSGVDLSYLDLTNCHINGYRVANKSFAADLKGAKLTDSFFMSFGHTEYLYTAHFDSKRRYIVSASADGTAKVWDANTYEEVSGGKLRGHKGEVLSAQFSQDEDARYIVTASKDGTAKVWERENYSLVATLEGHTDTVNTARFSRDGRFIVTASDDATAKIWDTKTYTVVASLTKHKAAINYAQFSQDGKFILTASDDKKAIVWKFDKKTCTPEIACVIKGHKDKVNSAVFSQDGKHIVTASDDKTAILWRFDKKTCEIKVIGILDKHTDKVNSAEFSADGRLIVTTSNDETAKVWDTGTCQQLPGGVLETGCHDIRLATFSFDGKYILTNTWRDIKVWDAVTFSEVPGEVINTHLSRLFAAEYSPDGKKITVCCREGTVKIFDAATFTEVPDGVLKGHSHSVYTAKYGCHEKYIVTASGDRTARIWDACTFREIQTDIPMDHTENVTYAEFDPNGDLITTASKDKTVKIWEWDDKTKEIKLQSVIDDYLQQVNSSVFSLDGKYILTAALDKTIKIRNVEDPRDFETIPGKYDRAVSAMFSPDGKKIISGHHGGTAIVWEAQKPYKMIKKLKHPTLSPSEPDMLKRTFATYDKDMNYIATCSWNGTVQIWDANTYRKIKNGFFTDHTNSVSAVQFSPDGRYIITSSWDNTVNVYDVEDDFKLIHVIHSIPGLEIWNINLGSLHETSELSEEVKGYLSEYGADFTDTEQEEDEG